MAAKFVGDLDQETWQSTLANYQTVLVKKAEKKTKKEGKDELIRMDKWYQDTLPAEISARTPDKHIVSEELVELVKWKLSRGKFRPRLVDFAKSNPADEVVKLSMAAFKSADSGKPDGVLKAIDTLSKMKGIGPATASAILAAGCPDNAPFMSDESTYDILQTPKLKYDKREYNEYHKAVVQIRDQLNGDDPAFGWTAHKVELALWTRNLAAQLGVDLTVSAPKTKVTAATTKSDDNNNEGEKPSPQKKSSKKSSSSGKRKESSKADEATETSSGKESTEMKAIPATKEFDTSSEDEELAPQKKSSKKSSSSSSKRKESSKVDEATKMSSEKVSTQTKSITAAKESDDNSSEDEEPQKKSSKKSSSSSSKRKEPSKADAATETSSKKSSKKRKR